MNSNEKTCNAIANSKEALELFEDLVYNDNFSCLECKHSKQFTMNPPYCRLNPELSEMQRNTTMIGDYCPYLKIEHSLNKLSRIEETVKEDKPMSYRLVKIKRILEEEIE